MTTAADVRRRAAELYLDRLPGPDQWLSTGDWRSLAQQAICDAARELTSYDASRVLPSQHPHSSAYVEARRQLDVEHGGFGRFLQWLEGDERFVARPADEVARHLAGD